MLSNLQKNPLTFNLCNSFLAKLVISILPLSLTLISTSSEASIIKQYDFENGSFSGVGRQYQDKTCSSSSDYIDNSLFDIVSSPGGRSGNAVKHQLKNCDERSELVVSGGTLKAEGEYWLGWSMYLPQNHNLPGNESYTIAQQMGFSNTCWLNTSGPNCNNLIKKPDGSITPKIGSPINALLPSISGTSLQYDLSGYIQTDSQGRHIFEKKVFTIPSKTEQWQDFVMYINLSSDPNQARVKLWKNDKLYINEATRLLPPSVSSLGDWKIGAYIGEPGNGERLLYTDELRVGDSASNYLEVVAPARRAKLIGLEQDTKVADFQLLAASESSVKLAASVPESIEDSEFSIKPAASVPESSMLVGLLAIGGAAVSLRLKRY